MKGNHQGHEGESNHQGHQAHEGESNHQDRQGHEGESNHQGRQGQHDDERRKTEFAPVPQRVDEIVRDVVDAAFAVHSELGPGFDERVYHRALLVEFRNRSLTFAEQVLVPVKYRGETLCHYRMDLIVADVVLVEVKAVKELLPIHQAQLMAYLKATAKRVGLLVNFNVKLIKHGIRRFVR
jgi:GxxExxY protein